MTAWRAGRIYSLRATAAAPITAKRVGAAKKGADVTA